MWPEVESVKNENKRELKLSGVTISEKIDGNGLDSSIFDISALNLLTISDTSLKIVPSEISNLTNLQTLLLYGNEITSLPDSISQLDKLKVLDVSRNRLTSIPSEIANLSQLTTINLSNNELSSFPSLTNSSKLLVIDLSNNKLAELPDIFHENNALLADILCKGNAIEKIPNDMVQLASLKHLNLANNKIKTLPKMLADIAKLKELDLSDNPIADKRLLKLIQQCRTKQIVDYVKQHGTEAEKSDKKGASDQKKSNKKKSKKSGQKNVPQHKINVQRTNDDTVKVIYNDLAKDVRPFILCCIVKDVNLCDGNFKKFLQIQTKLHESVCGKREKSTIATHDLLKLAPGGFIKYTAKSPDVLSIIPLGRSKKVTAEKLYDDLKAEAEALRKEKKRNVYSGIHKYLYLLENKDQFACIEDAAGNTISLPPLTNGDLTKISPNTTEVFIEVTSSSTMVDCRQTCEELLKEMLLAGFGKQAQLSEDDEDDIVNQLTVQQVKITDPEGNLKTVYPSKTDLYFDESANILIERD